MNLDKRFLLGQPLLAELRDNQLDRLREQRPEHQLETLKEWVDLAKAERAVKGRYRGRYLFELIQNANDAIAGTSADGQSVRVPNHVRLELSEHSLIAANFGQPFDEEGLRALCRLHKTTKNPNKQIGHKGIGFKSVLEISPTPEIYSGDYAFYFDGSRFQKDVEHIVGDQWEKEPLASLRTPYARDLTDLPPEERARLEALFDQGFATIVRLPFADSQTMLHVAERMREDVEPTLLLFLTAISQIELQFPDGEEIVFTREFRPSDHPDRNEMILRCRTQEEENIHSRWLVLGPYYEPLEDLSLLDDLEENAQESWKEVKALSFSLAFPLTQQGSALDISQHSFPFYVYFPTEEPSGLPFVVHADFHVGDDRKTLDSTKLNHWLAEHVGYYIAGEGVEHLKAQWPHDATLVDILAPVSRPERDFAQAFMEYYLESLQVTAFVPVENEEYRVPRDVRFPPEEVAFDTFTRLFPARALRGNEQWAYPLPSVAESEQARAHPFLLLPELGARFLTAEQVVESLLQTGMPPVEESYSLIAFLAGWFDRLSGTQRIAFLRLIRQLPIFPTVDGWQQPGGKLVFQANLRPDSPEVNTPPGFDFAVIRRDVYPDSGARSAQYRLFNELKAEEYSQRDIIRRAILPVLTTPELFEVLLATHRQSLFEAYRLLRQYFEEDRTTTGFEGRFARVPVYAGDGHAAGWQGWKPASECYFGSGWPDGELLEGLYRSFNDSYFMLPLPQEFAGQGNEQQRWMNFFNWLGVKRAPALQSSTNSLGEVDWPPSTQAYLWREYIETHDDHFTCPTRNNHRRSRSLDEIHWLHHWAEIIEDSNIEQLLSLYTLLAKNWTDLYQSSIYTMLRCNRTTCMTERIEDLFRFQLNNTPWLPVQVGEQWGEPLPPNRIWILGETDPADVRKLVPTLPLECRTGLYRDIAADLNLISSGNATVEDYLDLLQLLPERYPLEGIESWDDTQRRGWQASIQTVFNWAWEHIQTGLVSRGDENEPARPPTLQVLADRDGELCYVELGSDDLVYADDKRLARHWAPHCALLPINDDWKRLRTWLGVPDLSSLIVQEWQKGASSAELTKKLQERFSEVLPYYLALVKQSQPANYSRIAARLQRLEIRVVESLVVSERLEHRRDIEPARRVEPVHLEKTVLPNPKGGQSVRAGALYLTEAVLADLDKLGGFIADYIDIAHLADAFVILMERDNKDRLRFLASKGIDDAMVAGVFDDLQRPLEGLIGSLAAEMANELLENALQSAGVHPPMPTPTIPSVTVEASNVPSSLSGTAPSTADDPTPDSPEETQSSALATYPPLDFSIPFSISRFDPLILPAEPGGENHGSSGGNGHVPRQEVTEELGRRGEEWAYYAEKERLRELNLDPDSLEASGELQWVSRSNPTANHDIRSVSLNEQGDKRTVYIEVKSTSGSGRAIHMSRSEFELALSQGESYWLYWVSHIESATPHGPFCLPNFAQLLINKQIDLHIQTLTMTLPKVANISNNKLE